MRITVGYGGPARGQARLGSCDDDWDHSDPYCLLTVPVGWYEHAVAGAGPLIIIIVDSSPRPGSTLWAFLLGAGLVSVASGAAQTSRCC